MAFKDLFIVSEENGTAMNPKVPADNSNKAVNAAPAVVETVVAVSESSIMADEDIINKIWDKIIASNRPGPDYLELKNNVDALEDLPISGEQKIISAFKVLRKNYPSLQKEDITKAIDFYVTVVNEEKASGLSELESLKASNVTKVEDEIRGLQEKAEAMKREYDAIQKSIGDLTAKLAVAKNDIERKNGTFARSIDAVLSVLSADKENIMKINFN